MASIELSSRPGHQSVTGLVAYYAATKGDKTAVSFESESITYKALEEQTSRIAGWLRSRVAPGSQVSLYLPNSPALVVFFVAGVRAGMEVQVFDSDWPVSVVDTLLMSLTPNLLITHTTEIDYKKRLHIPDAYTPFLAVADIVEPKADRAELEEPLSTAPFYTGFTSGSSGPPKGFRRDHRSWLASFANDQFECPVNQSDVIVAPGALSHSLFLYALLRGLHAGVPVVICRRFSSRNVARVIAQSEATILYSVPAQIGTLIRLPAENYTSVRRVFSSGAKWPEGWRERFYNAFAKAELCEFYGASELSFITIAKSSEQVPVKSVGRAFSQVAIEVRNPDGKVLPTGEVGEVFVQSDMLFLGYAGDAGRRSQNNEGASAGDLGYLDEAGFLFLVGRADRMIVVSGKNVYPEEVENVLLMHSAVANAAVVPVADEKRGQRLLAVVRFDSGDSLSRPDLVQHCRQSLPQYKVPTMYAVCEDWPSTRSGKTDYRAIENNWFENALSLIK